MNRSRRTFVALALVALFALALPLALADEAKKAEVKPYPLETCIVSDEKLGEMGEVVTKVHDGQEFKFCCKHCIKDFDKDPAKFHAKLKEQVAKQEKDKNKKG